MDPRTRIGDADRERTVAVLQEAAAGGYLTLDEFSERSAAAYRAGTRGELDTVTRDLVPATRPARERRTAGAVAGRRRWPPAAVMVAALVGAVLLGVIGWVAMMIMMGGMGRMMP